MSTRTCMVANVCVFIAKPTTSQLVVECPLCSPSRCPAEMYPYILDKANRLEFVCDSRGRVTFVMVSVGWICTSHDEAASTQVYTLLHLPLHPLNCHTLEIHDFLRAKMNTVISICVVDLFI